MIEPEVKSIFSSSENNKQLKETKKIQLTEEQKILLEKNIKYLEANFQWFGDNIYPGGEGLIEDYKDLIEDGYNEGDPIIEFMLPAEEEYYSIEIDDFNTYIDEFKTLRFTDNIFITDNFAYLKILPNFTGENYHIYTENCLEVFTSDKISVSYDEGCFIPALDIIQEEGYSEDMGFYPTSNNYYLVVKKHGGGKLKVEECIKNINIYKYLAQTKLGISFANDTLFFKQYDEEYFEENNLEGDYIKDYPIDCIKDYTEAKVITNQQVRYTLLFRVLEYISVSSSHAELLESVNLKLDEFKGKNIEGTDIKEIVGIIKSKKITDDYIKTLLDFISIIDFVDLLPKYIKDRVFDGANIDTKKLSSFLTNTRHRYSHAKPNYNIKEFECKEADIEDFNIFVDKLVQQSIDWYIDLEDYLKIK